MIAEAGIVREMRASHEEAVVADDRLGAFHAASVDRAMLPDAVSVADANGAVGALLKGEVLRISADDGAVADRVFKTHDDISANDSVRLDFAAITDLRLTFDDGVRSDGDIRAESGF